MCQLSFYLRNSLCMELFRKFNFPFPNPSSNYFFLYWARKHLCISWTCSFGKSLGFLAVNLIYLERLQFTCFKALRKSNYKQFTFLMSNAGKQENFRLCRYLNKAVTFFISAKRTFCPSNNPWLILSSPQGLWNIQSPCFGFRPWFGWTLERRISWPKR